MIRRAALIALFCAAVRLPAQDASVTLFNNGRVLVRRVVPVAVAQGASSRTLSLGLFEPSSLTSLDAGVSITRVGYDPTWSEDALLRRSIGKQFTFFRSRDATGNKVERATLLALDPERWRLDPDNVVIFGRPGQLQWPVDQVPASPVADVTIESDRARTALNLMYQSSGAGWSAQYRIFVGAQARVEGSASLQTGRLDLTNAEVQLLAGNIGQPMPMASPMAMNAMADRKVAFESAASEEAVGEAHLYTLPGRVTFVPGTEIVMPLFAPASARAERRYTVHGALPYYGGFGQENEEQPVPVQVAWRLDRKLGSAFGDIPLPAGSVSVFDTDKAGRPQLIGQGAIGHTAAGAELMINAGTAFDITARRTQTEFSTTRATTGSRTIATIGYSVTLQNAKDSAVTVDVLEERGGEWSVLTSSVPAQKRSSSRTAFVVTLPARGSATLTYRLRVIW